MAVTIDIPSPLRQITKGANPVQAGGRSVKELFVNINETYPGFLDRVFDQDGSLRGFINVYVNKQNIKALQGVETAVNDGDQVYIVLPIVGG